jgi:leucine dehydrogenase
MLSAKTLDLSNHPSFDHHEQVVHFEDESLGLQALIAVHNTNLGPALGGCRFFPYTSFDAAVTDVLRLSRGMTYKSALARLPLGGGKAVIIGDPKTLKTPAIMERFGEAIERLGGQYITAEDVGSNEQDMIAINRTTQHVAGLPPTEGESGIVTGNPSPVTAFGVYCGLKAAVAEKYGSPDLAGKTVAIQGLGAVGYVLAEYLASDGARLIVADVNQSSLELARKAFGDRVSVVDTARIHAAEADIFSPCALGAGLNDTTIPEIKAKVVAGAANNQLAEPSLHDQMLFERGILYAPDYAINAGGIISVGYEYYGRRKHTPYDHPLTAENMMRHVEKIGPTLLDIFSISRQKKVSTGQAADSLAEQVFRADSSPLSSSAA